MKELRHFGRGEAGRGGTGERWTHRCSELRLRELRKPLKTFSHVFFVVVVVVATLDPGNWEELHRREKGKETSLKARGTALPPLFHVALRTALERQV